LVLFNMKPIDSSRLKSIFSSNHDNSCYDNYICCSCSSQERTRQFI